MNSLPIGELAALGTSLCWSFTGLLFTMGARRVGAQAVNLSRLLLALLIMLALHRLVQGAWLPQDAGAFEWGWLALSGVVGLALGDAALFQSMLLLGTRRALLMMALVPIISTFLAWAVLGELLAWVDLLAVLLTVAGVAWVILERHDGPLRREARRDLLMGVVFGFVAAAGQSLGLILSRHGMPADFSVISAQLIRIIAACGVVWLWAALRGQAGRVVTDVWRDRRASLAILGATFIGPVIGVLLSLVAITRAPVGIASTLMSLAPIMVLPLVHFAFRERVSWRAVSGAALAVVGVALIFLA